LDPAVSLVIAAVIFWGTWKLLRDAFHLAMGAAPRGIDMEAVRAFLSSLPGVEEVHDLHVWGLSTSEVALSGHLVKPDPSDDDVLIEQASNELRARFDVDHTTLQWERGGLADCREQSCDWALASPTGGESEPHDG
jgi:cobalt-zinc-cadmium efflux system protein